MQVWSIFGGSCPSRSVNCLLSILPTHHSTATSQHFCFSNRTFRNWVFKSCVMYLCIRNIISKIYSRSQSLKQHCTFRRKQSTGCAELGVMLAILFVLWKLWGTFRARQTCPPLVAGAAVRSCQQKEKCTTTCQDTRPPTITYYHSCFSWFSKKSKFKWFIKSAANS